jgi:hypothetical protein
LERYLGQVWFEKLKKEIVILYQHIEHFQSTLKRIKPYIGL